MRTARRRGVERPGRVGSCLAALGGERSFAARQQGDEVAPKSDLLLFNPARTVIATAPLTHRAGPHRHEASEDRLIIHFTDGRKFVFEVCDRPVLRFICTLPDVAMRSQLRVPRQSDCEYQSLLSAHNCLTPSPDEPRHLNDHGPATASDRPRPESEGRVAVEMASLTATGGHVLRM